MASRTAICRGILRINSGLGLRSTSSFWKDSNLLDTVPDNASIGVLIAKYGTLVGQRCLVTSKSSLRGGVGELLDCRPPFAVGIGGLRPFSKDVTQLPAIADREIENVFKDLMAASWDELPDALINDAKKALSKNTEDKAGQEILANVFRAAEAVEQFSGVLVSLRMEIDDSTGLSGENVRPLPDDLADALRAAYKRYTTYLDAFGPDEAYLRKKVETELGTKMIHLKMRCSGLGSEWGKSINPSKSERLKNKRLKRRKRIRKKGAVGSNRRRRD